MDDTQASDKALADAVRRAAQQLEQTIRNAEAAGMRVKIEIDKMDCTWVDALYVPHPTMVTIVGVSIERRTVVVL